ncbi:MAG TPA: RNA polymerase sigma factor [Terriglobia bacterium]|jgi:RNA polymerase sigma-70 factor (ECF subfamily)
MTAAAKRTNARSLPEGFEELFREHHGLIYRAAYRITGNAEDAEDVLQTLFVRLLRRSEPLDLEANPKGYLHRAAVNIALDIVRLRKRTVLPDEHTPGQNSRHNNAGILEMVEAALAGLSPKLAEMFVLKHVEGYDNGEIAKMIGTTRGVVAVLLFRARVRLKKSIRGQLKKTE